MKNCKNCGNSEKVEFGIRNCLKSGYYCDVTRMSDVLKSRFCDDNFSGWVPKLGAFQRLKQWIFGLVK